MYFASDAHRRTKKNCRLSFDQIEVYVNFATLIADFPTFIFFSVPEWSHLVDSMVAYASNPILMQLRNLYEKEVDQWRLRVYVEGDMPTWFDKLTACLPTLGFNDIVVNRQLSCVTASYRRMTLWATVRIVLRPMNGQIELTVYSTANVDNVYALFKNPNKRIFSKILEGIK